VLSGDHNREQLFGGQMLADLLRYMVDASVELDVSAGGVEVMSEGNETVPRALILAGIRPRPEIGTKNLFIEPGALLIVDKSEPTPDDSKLAYVVDPGVQNAGQLQLAAGFGGAVRIDVIECQRVESTIESDNRDLFNLNTGMFSPTFVPKVNAGRLQYRIRQGVPGMGFPGVEDGWLPLAVCAVPGGATTWDTVTVWDVRPLMADRLTPPFKMTPGITQEGRRQLYCDVLTDPAQNRVFGNIETSYGPWRAGGRLVTAAGDYFDLRDPANQVQGFGGFPVNGVFYVYLVFPFGLPRWVRYSEASLGGQRLPRGTRGIPIVSTAPADYNGRPIGTPISLPASLGLFELPTGDAVVAFAGRSDGANVPLGLLVDGHVTHFVNSPGWEYNATSTNASVSSTFTLIDSTTHPANARAVYVRLRLEVTLGPGTYPNPWFYEQRCYVGSPDGSLAQKIEPAIGVGRMSDVGMFNSAVREIGLTVRVPLVPNFTPGTGRTFSVRWEHAINAPFFDADVTGRGMEILGWELDP